MAKNLSRENNHAGDLSPAHQQHKTPNNKGPQKMKLIKDFFAGIATLAELAAILIRDREERSKYNYDYNGGEE